MPPEGEGPHYRFAGRSHGRHQVLRKRQFPPSVTEPQAGRQTERQIKRDGGDVRGLAHAKPLTAHERARKGQQKEGRAGRQGEAGQVERGRI